MRKIIRSIFALMLVVFTAFSLFACSTSAGLTENDDWNNNISVYQRKKELAHTELISYESEEKAKAAVIENSANYLSLNGTWDFTLAKKLSEVPNDFALASFVYPDPAMAGETSKKNILYWSTIQVPGSWDLQGFDAPIYTDTSKYPWANNITPANTSLTYLPIGLYRKEVDIPADWNGSSVFINFEGVSSAFYVYVNGSMVGYSEDSYTSSEFYITPYLKAGEKNLISVKVFKFADSSWIEAQDSMKLGGITRDVYLYSTPTCRISDIAVESVLDETNENAVIQVNLKVQEFGKSTKNDMFVKATIYDQNGNVYSAENSLSAKVSFDVSKTSDTYYSGKIGGRIKVAAPQLWTAETPYLYTVVAKLCNADGTVIDTVSQRFGVRTTIVTQDDTGRKTLLVNGNPVTLYGINYNEHDSKTGSTVSYDTLLADVKLMKSLNINAIRSPGRPLSIDMLNLCDEYGIYVIDDMNMCSNPYAYDEDAPIPGNQTLWQQTCLDRLIGVVNRDKNHPSVIVWSLGTESGVDAGNLTYLRNYLLSNDKNRAIVYDTDETVSDIFVSYDESLADVYDYINNEDSKKQLLFQSDNMGYLNGAGNLNTWSELYQNDRVLGGFLANWIDYAIYTAAADGSSELTYSGSWNEEISSGYIGLRGILSADRTVQSDAVEFGNAYSPVYVKPIDLYSGKFTVFNRYDFTTVNSSDYEIRYELFMGADSVKTGTLLFEELAPHTSCDVTIDYGTLRANTEYFVTVEVVYKNKPVWASDAEQIMSSVQYEITDYAVMPKTVKVNPTGAAFVSSTFYTPDVSSSAVDIIKTGSFFFTNETNYNLNELFNLSYKVYETNNTEKYIKQETGEVWESPGKIVYCKGDVPDFSVPAGSAYGEVRIPFGSLVNAVDVGEYEIELILTLKKDVAGVPAGYKAIYTFDKSTLGEKIAFKVDPSRTPEPVLDEAGKPLYDEESFLKIMTGGDPVYVPSGEEDDDESYDEYDAYILFDNGTVQLKIDNSTGLISKYTVNGMDIFANQTKSPVGNFVRQNSGGDFNSEVSEKKNATVTSQISSNNSMKKLTEPITIEKITDDHYRFTMKYIIATYPYEVYGSDSSNSDYVVTYDLYGNGELVVGVAYSPAAFDGTIPYEISSVITLDGGFKTVSWYGRGLGESFRDKLAGTKIGIYKDIKIADTIDDYLYTTASSNKEGVRWAVFKNENGNGFMLTSDTDTFAMNISKWYPWNTVAYSRTRLNNNNTIVRVIADSRGINAGNMSDAAYYSETATVNPGASYSYSFRISPMTSSDNAETKAKEYVETVLPEISGSDLTDGSVFALINIADTSVYLTEKDSILQFASGTGSDLQIWKKISASDIGMPNNFRLYNCGIEKYLTVSTYASPVDRATIDFGFADYYSIMWQNYGCDASNELMVMILGSSVHAMDYDGIFYMGTRVTGREKRGLAQSCWTFEFIDGSDELCLIKNNKTGQYLTGVQNLSFRNPVTENLYKRYSEYAPSTDWSTYENIIAAEPITDFESYKSQFKNPLMDVDWIPTDGSVTTWQLLPGNTQQWKFVRIDDNHYMIENQQTGKVVTFSDGTLSETTASGSADQIWTVYNVNGLYGFVNEKSGLAISAEASDDGIVLCLIDWKKLPNQLWKLCSEDSMAISLEVGPDWFRFDGEE